MGNTERFRGRISMTRQGRAMPGRDTLLARIGAIRHAIETQERARCRAVIRLGDHPVGAGSVTRIARLAGSVDRLELSYPEGAPMPVIEIRPDDAAGLTRIFADGSCIAVLSGPAALEQTDIRLTREPEIRRGEIRREEFRRGRPA